MKNEQAIREVINRYVEGVREFNFEKAESAWNSDGIKISYNKTIKKLEFQRMLDSRPPETIKNLGIKQEARIIDLDYINSIAIVKLNWIQERDDKRTEFMDYISLIKTDDEWMIVSKISDVK